ncbi:MAG: glycoside hydrolase family 99-like domain-containing protein, partial [Verrucomicrobia bacterium]|nr:glycoside hydrolase family 99-like domain-containing protein [Verrucomicrobiota bacterium]
QPFIRELATGYLLQYSFLSPRPYCWPEESTVMLSGWEVDKSGGHYEYHPTCLYPDGFAFHSDWFKLVDTSTNGAITLKHKVARQTGGKLTLEFRFRLAGAMDGACWQLRDLEHAGVSLVTRAGHLCWETGKVLMPCETQREYGVKVVADIDSKKADVFVDGEVKAKGLPFVHPVRSIDYVLVKTGDAATGEMFLNPVNLHKGYIVNETFVTCGVGKIPADWRSTGGSVQAFECGTKPDIFSLKVDGEARRAIGAWKGKTVFECRFLLPGTVDGVGVSLGGVALERAVLYRSNFWYMAKVIADPKARTAEVWINGKLLPEKISFPKAEKWIRFVGNVWVDDVQVYPWRDYPADYVPQPKPAAASHLLGVQSCNLWREGTAYAGWDYVYPFADKRKPYLGWYDEGNPEETDWEIKWQVEHGIGFEMHCWYRPNNAINHPIKDGVLDQGIIKGLFNARYGKLKKFAIMCTDEGACETNPQDWRENIIPYWIEYFFKEPRYMKIDGKPVLSIYQPGNFQRMFGGNDGARQAVQTLREEVAKAGFPGLVLLMELRTADRNTMKMMKSMGVDYCYAYTWGTADVDAQRRNNIAQRDAAAAEQFGMLPSISMGWDREAWGVHDGGWVPMADYRSLLAWARDEFLPSQPADSPGRRIVMLPNWNEFSEGHFMLPNTSAGFGYLDAMREVFTPGGAHDDVA